MVIPAPSCHPNVEAHLSSYSIEQTVMRVQGVAIKIS